ncbi:MAG: M23 family metallopeptidase [Nitrospinae bacterium]|nr:M23 family metallopeptidase [Nitrospinota bacterium]
MKLKRSILFFIFLLSTLFFIQDCTLLSPSKRADKKRVAKPSVKVERGYFIWPLKGKLTSGFGFRSKRKHDGIDIAAPKGTNIFAAADGKVIFSGWGPTGYGKLVIVKHSNKYVTVYAHNYKNFTENGQTVKKGEKIALVGDTGRATGPHLHFELRVNRIPVDPLPFLP